MLKVQAELEHFLTNEGIGRHSSTFQVFTINMMTFERSWKQIVSSFPIKSVPFSDSLRDIQNQIADSCEKDLNVQLHFIESLHISLTRTVVLQHHWIDEFKKSIKDCIVDFKR